MFTAKIPPEYEQYLNFIWKMLSNIAMEAKFTVSDKGILIQAMDPASTTYVEILLKKEFFREIKGTVSFNVDTLQTKEIPGIMNFKGAEVELSGDQLKLNYRKTGEGGLINNFSTINITGLKRKYPVLKMNKGAEACISTKSLRKHVSSRNAISDKVKIACDGSKGKIGFLFEGELSKSWTIHKAKPPHEYVNTIGKNKVSEEYLLEYIQVFLEHTSKLFDYVGIRFGKGKYLELKTEKLDLIEVRALFAPVT